MSSSQALPRPPTLCTPRSLQLIPPATGKTRASLYSSYETMKCHSDSIFDSVRGESEDSSISVNKPRHGERSKFYDAKLSGVTVKGLRASCQEETSRGEPIVSTRLAQLSECH